MALTATISTAIQLSTSYQAISGSVSISDGQATQFNNTITNNNVAEVLNIAFDKTKIKSVYVVSDTNVTLTFGNVSALTNIALVANAPFSWNSGDYLPSPWDNNVTNITLVNNNAATNAVVQGVLIIDPT